MEVVVGSLALHTRAQLLEMPRSLSFIIGSLALHALIRLSLRFRRRVGGGLGQATPPLRPLRMGEGEGRGSRAADEGRHRQKHHAGVGWSKPHHY